jgi:hypothetical protein
MDGNELRELQNRGRFFWETFPGAKASDEWTRDRDRSEQMTQNVHRKEGRTTDRSERLPVTALPRA